MPSAGRKQRDFIWEKETKERETISGGKKTEADMERETDTQETCRRSDGEIEIEENGSGTPLLIKIFCG